MCVEYKKEKVFVIVGFMNPMTVGNIETFFSDIFTGLVQCSSSINRVLVRKIDSELLTYSSFHCVVYSDNRFKQTDTNTKVGVDGL